MFCIIKWVASLLRRVCCELVPVFVVWTQASSLAGLVAVLRAVWPGLAALLY